jgi:hypothetical protein
MIEYEAATIWCGCRVNMPQLPAQFSQGEVLPGRLPMILRGRGGDRGPMRLREIVMLLDRRRQGVPVAAIACRSRLDPRPSANTSLAGAAAMDRGRPATSPLDQGKIETRYGLGYLVGATEKRQARKLLSRTFLHRYTKHRHRGVTPFP